jgi:hypothetical protein
MTKHSIFALSRTNTKNLSKSFDGLPQILTKYTAYDSVGDFGG